MRKYKLLIIGPMPPPYTGMTVVTEMLLNSSLTDKLDIIYLDTSDKRAIANMGKFDLTNIILAIRHFFKFLRLLVGEGVDLVYLPVSQNFFGYLRDSLFLTACRIFRIKIIVHLNGGYFRRFYETSGSIIRSVIRFTLKKVSAAIVLGECLRYIFKDLVPDEKIIVVPNGINDYYPGDFIRKFSRSGIFKILFLSNLLRTKGLFEVLKVIPSVVSVNKNVMFSFAGEWGNKQEELKAREFVVRNNIEDYVQFLGIVRGDVKRELLIKANIFVLPTFYPFEGQPFTILEAMSVGLPVISTNKGAIAETIIDGENGFLVEVENTRQLSERIIELMDNPELCARIEKRNRQAYLKKYTKDIFIDNLCDIFVRIGEDAVLGEKKAKPKVLVLGYLPPPQEGTAKMTEIIMESSYLKNNFQMKLMPLLKRQYVTSRGKLDVVNVIQNLKNFLNYIYLIVVFVPDIIYIPLAQNRFGFLRDSLFILTGRILGKKMYVHFHGGNFDLFFQMRNNIFKKYIGFILRRIDKLILLAGKFSKQFTSFIDEKRITFVYNCVPYAFIMPKERIEWSSGKRVSRVLFMGYLSKAKGALDFVKTIPSVIAEYKCPVEFILCGQPVDIERNIVFIPDPHCGYTKIRNLIKKENILDCVKLYSEVVGKEKERMFSRADIFVFPSYSEGCGLVVLEAMAFGLPVITTPVGALEEMLVDGENCFFVKPGDIDNIAKKILFLLNNPNLREKIGVANRRLIKESYNPDVFLHNLAGIWNDALVGKR